jgi:hypothetical protein
VSWNWTLTTAVVGATTGTYGAIVSSLGRRDVTWRRRAKQLPTLRPALEALRDAVAEVQQGNRTIRALQDLALRAHLDELQERQPQLSDKVLSEHVTEVLHAYSSVIAAGDDSKDHRKAEAIRRAAESIRTALQRADQIEKKAPA